MTWKTSKKRTRRFANGPREIKKVGRCTLEAFEWCSTRNRGTPCPSGEFTYTIERKNRRGAKTTTVIAGPHGGARPLYTSIADAKRAALKRYLHDPRARSRCGVAKRR